MTRHASSRASWPDGGVTDVRLEWPRDARCLERGRLAQRRRAAGLVLPGFANTHSHAFHRALRGRTHDGGGTFWTWRRADVRPGRRLEPDTYFPLARAVFAEMALAGVTTVGEFHYLHHPDGRQYDDPNAFGAVIAAAAAEAGIRITLLDTCYLAGGLGPAGAALEPEQRRFSATAR